MHSSREGCLDYRNDSRDLECIQVERDVLSIDSFFDRFEKVIETNLV